ncbi:agrocinopine phosphodiesterase (plasmid) [Agrobacterium vitis]|uniref:Agrocinopine phosphodiesterase n=2 Tax=Agrobacterium vitis TaxID=373 RepID=A0AAE2R9W0_AGRVI|nr:agrocinopine phosphodiesterase [Agrobacterium vitis]
MSILRSETGTVHICGHRGHLVASPENTFASFRMAKKLGATICETDLVLSADGELILFHDATVDRTSNGKGLVSKMTLAELKALDVGSWFSPEFEGVRVPTLREAIVFARENGMLLQLELKVQGLDDLLFPKTAALLDELDAHDVVWFSSLDFRQLRDIKRQIPKVPTVGLSHTSFIDPVALAKEAHLDALQFDWHRFSPEEAIQLHRNGIAATVVVIATQKEIERRASYGDDIERRVAEWISDGHIDQLLGDDVAWVERVVRSAS